MTSKKVSLAAKKPLPAARLADIFAASHAGGLRCPWMGFVVDAPDRRSVQMRINLRRGDVRVPQHSLDGAQIRAALKKMGRETVPQLVR